MHELYRETTPTARIEHTCCECRVTIPPGDTYQRVTLSTDGRMSEAKTCQRCAWLRSAAITRAELEYTAADPTGQRFRFDPDDEGLPAFGWLLDWLHEWDYTDLAERITNQHQPTTETTP